MAGIVPWQVVVAIIIVIVSWVLFAPASKIKLRPAENIVVITGCDTGFGLMLANRLAKMGFKVVAACLTKEGVERLQNTVSLAVKCDMTKEADVKSLADATEAHSKKYNSRVWALVNNAGIAPTGSVDWQTMASHRKCFEINYFSVVYLIKCMLHLLKQTKYSRILCVSSVAGISGFANGTAYCGSKHAIEGMTKCLRQELKAWNIFVCNVSPGFMRTPIIENSKGLATVEFENAPKEITDQYNREALGSMDHVIQKIAEDPELVIDRLVDLITSSNPSLFNAVGYQAAFARFTLFWPQRLTTFLENALLRGTKQVKPEALARIQINKFKASQKSMVCSVFSAITVSYAGLLLFLYGFFLTRRELGQISQTNAPQLSSFFNHNANSSLNRHICNENESKLSFHEKPVPVFLFIVDALRLDFMVHYEGTQCSSSFNRFTADPPTVTSQRLKGLMTGTLPTFVDIGSNFNSSAITEDNIIDQLIHRRNSGRRKTFQIVLGDDTWKSVFPHQFDVVHVYDSFNTKDLHTVDNGILQHLNESLQQKWDLFVAHFLGVDHIGHSYHAHHPLMGERLSLMDQVLEQVVDQLSEDAVLLLFGDHGMTDEGEHGGASESETDSGLFVYRKNGDLFSVYSSPTDSDGDSKLTEQASSEGTVDYDGHYKWSWDADAGSFHCRTVSDLRSQPRMLSQIDLTPTLAQWLGVPVPYSSLGMLIPELFMAPSSSSTYSRSSSGCGTRSVTLLSDLLFVNAVQVWGYLLDYFGDQSTRRGDLDSINLSLLQLRSPPTVDSLKPLWSLLVDAVEKHTDALQREIFNTAAADKVSTSVDREVAARYIQFLTEAQHFGREQWTQFNLPCILAGLLLLFCAAVSLFPSCIALTAASVSQAVADPFSLVMLVLAVFHCVSVFSNSFIIEEHWTHLFAVQSFALYLVHQSGIVKAESIGGVDAESLFVLSGVLALLVLARLVWTTPVVDVIPLEPLVSLTLDATLTPLSDVVNWMEPFLWLLSLVIIGALHEPSKWHLFHRQRVHCGECLLAILWLMEAFPGPSEALMGPDWTKWLLLVLPRCILARFLLVLILNTIAGRQFAVLRQDIQHRLVSEVWGEWVWVVCLLQGSRCVGQIAVLLVHLTASVRLIEKCLMRSPAEPSVPSVPSVPAVPAVPSAESGRLKHQSLNVMTFWNAWWEWVTFKSENNHRKPRYLTPLQAVSIVVYFNVVGRYAFFVTGHGMTFAKLKLTSGFIGLESFNFVYSGILLAINTFGCDVLVLMALCVSSLRWHREGVTVKGATMRVGSFLMRVALVYRIALVLFSCTAAALHRRHLMVWAVFAPKVAFESAFWLVAGIVLVLLNIVVEV